MEIRRAGWDDLWRTARAAVSDLAPVDLEMGAWVRRLGRHPVALGLSGALQHFETWLAVAGREMMGYLALGAASQHLHIWLLGVRPGARRQGVGQALLAQAAARAHEQGYWWTGLSVTASNAPAVALYRQAGFTPWREVRFRRTAGAILPVQPDPALAIRRAAGAERRAALWEVGSQIRREAGLSAPVILRDLLPRSGLLRGTLYVLLRQDEIVGAAWRQGPETHPALTLALPPGEDVGGFLKLLVQQHMATPPALTVSFVSAVQAVAAREPLLALGFHEEPEPRWEMLRREWGAAAL